VEDEEEEVGDEEEEELEDEEDEEYIPHAHDPWKS